MRKFLFALAMLFFSALNVVHAQSVTAAGIFSSLGGTVSIDRGGAIDSQTRSIYSLGGGRVAFNGKRINLIAADAPSFKAGCSGISWHFGGFAFISVDELRQMVEAIAQASLGIALDLAMQTLCPQCYAVMNKLREIANQMRNASADACRTAQAFGSMLSKEFPTVFGADKSKQDCAYWMQDNASESGLMAQMGSGACALASSVSSTMNNAAKQVDDFVNGKGGAVPPAPAFQLEGNVTNTMLKALGYPDGFVKNLLLSIYGMSIYVASEDDCSRVSQNVRGSSGISTALVNELPQMALLSATPKQDGSSGEPSDQPSATGTTVTTTGAQTTASDLAVVYQKGSADATGSTKGSQACIFPPLISGLKDVGLFLLCGNNFVADYAHFANAYGIGSGASRDGLNATCGVGMASERTRHQYEAYEALNGRPMYVCEGSCLVPGFSTIAQQSALMNAQLSSKVGPASSPYTGLGLMVLDALYAGVDAVRDNAAVLPDKTIAILNASTYPLYRLINIAAVYPGVADDLLLAYGATIAANHAFDTLTKFVRVGGANVDIHITGLRAKNGSPAEIQQLRNSINELDTHSQAFVTDLLKTMEQKRALVQQLVDLNKAMQAEVVSSGLTGNADLAAALKTQVTKPAAGNGG